MWGIGATERVVSIPTIIIIILGDSADSPETLGRIMGDGGNYGGEAERCLNGDECPQERLVS